MTTNLLQGMRDNDFCWSTDEYAYLGIECDNDHDADGSCGCHRSFCGMKKHQASTTAVIKDKDISKEEYVKMYLASAKEAGFDIMAEDADELVDELIDVASNFEVGAVVEKRGDIIQHRGTVSPKQR